MLVFIAAICFSTGPAVGQTHPANTAPPVAEDHCNEPLLLWAPLIPRSGPGGEHDPGRTPPEVLLTRFIDQHSADHLDRAAELAVELVEIAPDVPLCHYNLACVRARQRLPELAIQSLELAVDLGWRRVGHMLIDPDLQTLRGLGAFTAVTERAASLARQETPGICPLRTDHPEIISQSIGAFVQETARDYRVPGVAVAYFTDQAVHWTYSHGLADAEHQRVLDEHDRFVVRGMTPVIAVYAGATEHAAGRLAFDTILHAAAMQTTSTTHHNARGHSGRVALTALTDRDLTNEPIFDPIICSRALQNGIESTADEPFETYCRRVVLGRLNLNQVDFDTAGSLRRSRYVEEPQLAPETVRNAVTDDNLVAGHSLFGTPVQHPLAVHDEDCEHDGVGRTRTRRVPPRSSKTHSEAMMLTSAHELAQLVRHLLADPGPGPSAVRSIAPYWIGPDRTLAEEHTPVSRRITMAENADGQGCLIRWYPETKTGVVVLFNSETGNLPARLIAQHALGGSL